MDTWIQGDTKDTAQNDHLRWENEGGRIILRPEKQVPRQDEPERGTHFEEIEDQFSSALRRMN